MAPTDEDIRKWRPFVIGIAKSYAKTELLQDLIQVGLLGLVKALQRYDPSRGTKFLTFASHYVRGEIQHHLRDNTWMIHAARKTRELNQSLLLVRAKLTQSLGRVPTPAEVMAASNVPIHKFRAAMALGFAYNVQSLDAELQRDRDERDGTTRKTFLGYEDVGFTRCEDHAVLEDALRTLPEDEAQVLRLRYYMGLSQTEIANRLGLWQKQVSRIEHQALGHMRRALAS